MVNVGQRNGIGDADATFVFLLENNIWRLLVDANAKAFKLGLDDLLICERLIDVENDKDQVTGLGHGDDLSSTTLAVFGALNDPGKIEHLYGGAIVKDLARNGGEGCEFIGSG